MNDTSAQKRQMLLQQIRQEQHQNNELPTEEPTMRSTFFLRMLVAALLFAGYFFLSRNEDGSGSVYAAKIRREVNKYSNIEINLFDFMEDITYTLNIDK